MSKKVIFSAYTDAASYNNGKRNHPNRPEHTCSAGLVHINDDIVYSFHNYNPNSTISYGELFAIHTILTEFGSLLQGTKHKLILYTDSEYCMKSINVWHYFWIKKAKNGIWYSSSGPVPYQSMWEEILYILYNNKNIQVKHISGGHLNVLDPRMISTTELGKVLKTCISRFKRNNGEDITEKEALNHIFYNNVCDQIAKEGLVRGMGGIENDRYRKTFEKYKS